MAGRGLMEGPAPHATNPLAVGCSMRKLAVLLILCALWAPDWAGAAAQDLNGQWHQTDEGPNLVLIAQDHEAVLVIYDGATPQGEKITYYGSGTLNGRRVEYAYTFTRSPKGWKNGDMQLDLSADGQSMEGFWVVGQDRGKVRFLRQR